MTTVRPPPPSNSLQGSCTLVGVGPGDPELLTLQAMRAIGVATVLLVDDLVSDAILALAPRNARVVRVGKRGVGQSTPQAFIAKLMLMAVQEGETVVRLKGGDPFIFGRGGEEAEHLRAAGIEVRVVNGITAGLAAPSALGIPLTHRDHAHGVLFISGHVRPGDAGTNWRLLGATASAARLTLVIYMGTGNAAHIQQELLCHLRPDTPVAIIENASQPRQRHAITSLEKLAATLEHAALVGPSIIVVGDVVQGAACLHQG